MDSNINIVIGIYAKKHGFLTFSKKQIIGGKMKKFISLFTMVAFIIFSLSCTTTKNVRLDADSTEKAKKEKILSVVMTSGVTIEFSEEQPCIIQNGNIIGTTVKVIGELDQAYIKSKAVDKKGKIGRMTVSIPLSEVEMIKIKEFELSKTLWVLLGIGAIVGIVYAVLAFSAMGGPGS